ncbi:hypothetical protein WSK_0686 [Novosphingobium sp. Rr 2-17]|uniref:hypothetical protein n=1 Tax=Novosphingobium sp. Rr 2-17 TaxID=555793 RepID=UPI0002697B01|nr:hypothetical protein [Novosphingobium sp. Rr 2-17]EIZ80713.1 hypothetical protein WSK_0686 [Novosphingobium sp. Rr 2-17]
MNTDTIGVTAEADRARIATLLSRYPHNAPEELAQIRRWFKKEASALDVGLLAADPAVADQYRAYRAVHHDRFSPKDWLRAAGFVGVAVALVGGMIALMP